MVKTFAAMLKYIIKLVMSKIVAIKGEETNAGSNLNSLNNMGVTVPTVLPTIEMAVTEAPTVIPR